MNERELRRYEMFGRVRTFGQTHAADFAADSVAATRFDNLKQIIASLDHAKGNPKRDGATSETVLLHALRLDLQNITRTALAMDQDTPGLADKFRAPTSASDADLRSTADLILSRLLPARDDGPSIQVAKATLVARFVAHELPADFVQRLHRDRDALDALSSGNDGTESADVGAATIGRLMTAAMKEVAYLDAIAHNKYVRNTDKLHAWTSASHTDRGPQRPKPSLHSSSKPTPA